jgi:hypothetical protein
VGVDYALVIITNCCCLTTTELPNVDLHQNSVDQQPPWCPISIWINSRIGG